MSSSADLVIGKATMQECPGSAFLTLDG